MIKVLLIDDHDIVRTGVSRLLADVEDINIIGEADSGEQGLSLAKKYMPDVILLDFKMSGIGGLEFTKKILRSEPNVKVIILTSYTKEPLPSKLLQAGAFGYVTKDSGLREIVNAIRKVYGGEKYLSAKIAHQLAIKSVSEKNEKGMLSTLSERELQVMLMITNGKSVQLISDDLCLSPKTINSYRYRLFDKLDVTNDVELTHFAIRHGMLDTELSD